MISFFGRESVWSGSDRGIGKGEGQRVVNIVFWCAFSFKTGLFLISTFRVLNPYGTRDGNDYLMNNTKPMNQSNFGILQSPQQKNQAPL